MDSSYTQEGNAGLSVIMRTLFIYAIRLLLWVGIPFLLGIVLYKISKHDTALMNEDVDRSGSELK